MHYLLDSDWVVDYLKGLAHAMDLVHRFASDGLATSVITLAEVYEGIYYGRDLGREEQALLQFLRGVIVLDVDADVARRYAVVRGSLRQQGILIPQPDILITSTALQYDLPLVTRNLRHSQRIPDLKLFQQPSDPT